MRKSSRHSSQRGWFAYELYQQMKKDKKIVLLCLDLGYRVFDEHFASFPDRCFNLGASEQAGVGIAVGMALEGKKPFIYSITPFLLYRPFETIRNYIHYEEIPVRLVGSGRSDDYKQDGFSHWSKEEGAVMEIFKNIKAWWPETKEEIPKIVKEMAVSNKPSFLSLRR